MLSPTSSSSSYMPMLDWMLNQSYARLMHHTQHDNKFYLVLELLQNLGQPRGRMKVFWLACTAHVRVFSCSRMHETPECAWWVSVVHHHGILKQSILMKSMVVGSMSMAMILQGQADMLRPELDAQLSQSFFLAYAWRTHVKTPRKNMAKYHCKNDDAYSQWLRRQNRPEYLGDVCFRWTLPLGVRNQETHVK